MKYFDSYTDIKKLKPHGIRGQLRSLALDGLSVWDKINGIEHLLSKPRVQFLLLHHVFKDEETKFETLLKKLSVNHEFISYSEGVDKILDGKIDKPYICFSSDDGFKNNLRAAEILNDYGAKGCFFINPGIIEKKQFAEIESHCRDKLDFPAVHFMNWNDIEKLQKMGHEIGSHTMEHINIAQTEKEVFVEDCYKTREVLHDRCGEARHFAFPYGRFFHFSEIGRDIVFDSGFVSCASGERGCHINHDKLLENRELCIRRDHVVLDWNLDHVFHFIAKNARKTSAYNNTFPYLNQNKP
jgi:peptidoglycan/xylan/chitin deacetylase (PgdA/CDA1 family)